MTLAPASGEARPRDGRGARGAPGTVVLAQAGERPRALLARVGLGGDERRPVIVVCGGADELRGPQLAAARSVLGPAIRAAASSTGAAIVDGGTAAGVMELLGAERAREPATMPVLLGVAPAGKVEHPDARGEGRTALEHRHTHFVLADSDEWGGETPLLAGVAEELSRGAPVVMVLAGGGAGARAEVREAVARRWPLFALEGTGGVAEEVAAAARKRRKGAALAGELAGGDIRPVSSRDPIGLGRSLAWELQDEGTLKDAWVLFASYDRLAIRLRRTFERFQAAILLLGIIATAIALLYDSVDWRPLHWAAVTAPIVISVLIALANRRAAGKRWVLLRAAAEAVKTEIYRYRTRTGVYSRDALDSGDPVEGPRRLAERLAAIEGKLIQSDASGGPLTPYDGLLPPDAYGAEASDDGLSRMGAERYVEIRVADQLAYYRSRVSNLDRRRGVLQVVTLAAGGAGAVLAAAGEEIWIGLTTALAGAALAHLGYLQIDSTIVAYNQAAAKLAALEREFRAGAGATAMEPEDLDLLVTRGEAVLTTELGGWVQQMTEALAEIQAEQSEAAAKVEAPQDK